MDCPPSTPAGFWPQYWMNLQADHDLKTAQASLGARLADVQALTA